MQRLVVRLYSRHLCWFKQASYVPGQQSAGCVNVNSRLCLSVGKSGGDQLSEQQEEPLTPLQDPAPSVQVNTSSAV